MEAALRIYSYFLEDFPLCVFVATFIFRYLRLIVHVPAFYWLYRPAPEKPNPKYTGQDVTVILPTVSPGNPNFRACLRNCCANFPRRILLITVGETLEQDARNAVEEEIPGKFDGVQVDVMTADRASKRIQVGKGIRMSRTAITVLMDDSVVWAPTFLQSILAAFEDPQVGLAGTNKRVYRVKEGGWRANFWNIMGAIYLARANFDTIAPNVIDGGVPVISGRTSAIRTAIVKNREFLNMFEDERFYLFGFIPPPTQPGINPDDDNAITRFVVNRRWKIKFQHCDQQSLVTTSLGQDPKRFRGQLLRWARTTFRSNPRSLCDPVVWETQPWSVYAVQLSMLINFALLFDAFLMTALLRTKLAAESKHPLWLYLIIWFIFAKTVKLLPYFRENPRDIWILPWYWGFGYWHSFMKLWALLTFDDVSWTGRVLPPANPVPAPQTAG